VVREYAQLVQAARAEAGEAATHLTTVRQELEDTRKTISFLEGQVRLVYIARTPQSTDAMSVCIVVTVPLTLLAQRHSLQESLAQAEAERADLVAASAAELQGKDDDLVRLRSTMAEAAAERDRLSAELAAAQACVWGLAWASHGAGC
jgi:predicted  nucleic acid-binding Zn-ribbon protein